MEIISVKKSTSKIKRISPAGSTTTYDFTVKDTHRILANGFYTSNCNSPELETFIDVKRNLKKVTGANISIRWHDDFMHAIKNNTDYTLRWPVEASVEDAKVTKVVKARDIWEKFIDAAWSMAEPGALFWDTVISNSIADCYSDVGYETKSTNPCSELPLSPYDSCRLMVVNLASFVKTPFLTIASFDFARFKYVVMKAQRLMDDLVDLEIESVDKIIAKIESGDELEHIKSVELNLWKKIRAATLGGRRTGLGITGLGDCLAALNLKYGSSESITMTEEIYKTLAIGAHTSSCVLARERGAFSVFDFKKEKDNAYLKKIMSACGPDVVEMWLKTGRRNIALTTIAPTGSVSTMTQTTSGIEPAFLLSYKRRRKITQGDFTSRVDFTDPMGDKWQEYIVYHHWFQKWMDITGLSKVEDSPYHGATANDIDWVKSIDIQAAAQRWIDHGISKTVNLPATATKEIVNNVYLHAWESGCKGATVYRDGCRTGVLVSTEQIAEKKVEADRSSIKRPKTLICDLHRANVKNGDSSDSWLVLVGLLDGRPYEVFCGIPEFVSIPKKYKSGSLVKNGKRDGMSTYNLVVPVGDDENLVFKDISNLFDNPTQGAFSRTISLALRHNVPLQYIVEQAQKDKHSDMFSFARVIARVLKGYITDGTKSSSGGCPECNSILVYQEGCLRCSNCGYSKCS